VEIAAVSSSEIAGVPKAGVGRASEVSAGASLLNKAVGVETVSFTRVGEARVGDSGVVVLLRNTGVAEVTDAVSRMVLMIELLLCALEVPPVVIVGSTRLVEIVTPGVIKVPLKPELADPLALDSVVGPVALTAAEDVMVSGNVDRSVALAVVKVVMSVGVAVNVPDDKVASPTRGSLVELTSSEDATVGLPTAVLLAKVASGLEEDTIWLLETSATVELLSAEDWLISEIVGRATVVLRKIGVVKAWLEERETRLGVRLSGEERLVPETGSEVVQSIPDSVTVGSTADNESDGMVPAGVLPLPKSVPTGVAESVVGWKNGRSVSVLKMGSVDRLGADCPYWKTGFP
jgi:hypothetical protein